MKDHSFLKYYEQQPRADPAGQIFHIAKADDEKRMVFGWASVAALQDGSTVEDYQKDVIDIYDLEAAVYEYCLYFRDGGEMHQRRGTGIMVESIVFTPDKIKALGIPEGILPFGWWLGLKITDESVWEKVKNGSYSMFSIEGEAVRQPISETEDDSNE